MTAAAQPLIPPFDGAMECILAPPAEAPVPPMDGTYDAIREALREDDPRLPQGIWQTERKRADPARAAGLAVEAMRHRAKDLYVAGWLLEAWTRLHGFAGMRDGLRMLVRLCQAHGQALHPAPTDDDPEARDRAWEHLAARLPAVARGVPLAQPGPGRDDTFTWHDLQAAAHREHRGETDGDGAPTSADIQAAEAHTPPAFYAATARVLGEALQALDALGTQQARLAEHAGGLPPSLSTPRRTLAEIRAWAASKVAERGGAAPEPGPDPEADPDAHPGAGPARDAHGPPAPAGDERSPRVGSRAEAYRMLAAAAEFLARAEPHSPVPALVRRAVAWGALDLAGLAAELARESYDPTTLRSLLGLSRDERR